MALWLTHLRIAEKVKNKIKDIDLDYLMIGSISASIAVMDKCYRDSLMLDVSKYILEIDISKHNKLINEFYNEHMEPEKLIIRSDKTRSFLWGCYFHFITNKEWIERFYAVFHKEYTENAERKIDENMFIQKHIEALDYKYLNETNSSILNKLMEINLSINYFDLLDSDYINQFKSRIVQYYSTVDTSSVFTMAGYDLKDIEDFIQKTSDKCVHTLLY